ncbi:YncE family protein [Lacticaseibacillus rhamnosus]
MGKVAYVTNTDSNDISVVDLQTSSEINRIAIGDSPRGAMAIDKKRGLGFVSNCAGNTISVVDLVKGRELDRITVGLAPRGVDISPDFNLLFVANSGSKSVSIVDLDQLSVVATLDVQRNPRQLQVTKDGALVVVPNFGSSSVSVLQIDYDNPNHSKNIGNVILGGDKCPYHAYPDEEGRLAFTANTFDHSISVIDITKLSVIKTIPTGFGPRAVITEPSGKYLLVTAEASNALCVIERSTLREIKRIPVGGTPRGLIVDPDTHIILISDFNRTSTTLEADVRQDKMTVVDLDSLERIGNLPTGLGACSVNILETSDIENGSAVLLPEYALE